MDNFFVNHRIVVFHYTNFINQLKTLKLIHKYVTYVGPSSDLK